MNVSRGTTTRPTGDEIANPQAAREARVRAIFKEQAKFLAALFPKEGMMHV